MTDRKRLVTVADINKIKYLDDPQISPDGKWIAYVQQSANSLAKGYDRNIYIVSTTGGDPIQLTRSGKDTNPRWSPDGTRLAFVSARSEKPQIHILPVNQPGESRPVTSHDNGAASPAWSPDGAHIAYLSGNNVAEREQEDSGEELEKPVDELEAKHRNERKVEDEKNRFDPRLVDKTPFREGTTFNDDRHAQIYLIATREDLEGDAAKPRRLTSTTTNYSPPQWSKSGRHIVTTRAWDIQADEPIRWSNIYLIEVESGIERRIKDDTYRYFNAIPSYDGNWLVAVRNNATSVDNLLRLCILPLEGGDVRDLNLELDRSIVDYDWTEDGQLIVIAESWGRSEIHRLDPQTKTFTPLVSDDQGLFGMSVASGTIAYISRTATRLDELFYKRADDAPKQMTNANTDFVNEVEVLETHEIRFRNPQGQEIQGWYILPPDYKEGERFPLALNIHGGPRGMWLPGYRAMWLEWQTHAAEGYVVFYCNPRGSEGYGEAHIKALTSAWGSVAMQDIMAGVDHLIDKGIVDGDRMVLSGGSYGGYMTAWIIGHTDRFKAAVTQRGVYNLVSLYSTTDYPFFLGKWFDTVPWESHEKLWEHSPLAYAHKVTTPTLIIHSENDFRVPIEQGEQLFAWIRRATDTPVKLLRYPREGHELSRSGEPAHRINRLTEMMNWFKQYCNPSKPGM